MKMGLMLRVEFWLEQQKRFNNATLDFLKRIYDGCSIVERYGRLEISLSVYFLARDGIFCAKYRKRKALEIGISERRVDRDRRQAYEAHELSVLVFVRCFTKRAR